MCHANDDIPPRSPAFGRSVNSQALTLVAKDGDEISAAYANPEVDARAGVVILPDARGLHPVYRALAEEFAAGGVAAIAIDYYDRILGPLHSPRPDDFPWQEYLQLF
jgi:carboxymethylenebutenolidase